MPLIPDAATFQESLAMLPISTYEPGETVIAAGATTGKLLLLRKGVVEVAREGTQIARISEPGSVFGELAVLLDKPHTADVRAVERSVFSVADGATLLTSDPAATLYIAAILAAPPGRRQRRADRDQAPTRNGQASRRDSSDSREDC